LSFSNVDHVRNRIEELKNTLNKGQINAIESILEDPLQEDSFLLPIVDGPPGTGKTTVGAYASVRGILEGIVQGIIYVVPTNFAAWQAKKAFENLSVPQRDVIWLNPRTNVKNWDTGVVGVKWDLSDLGPNDIRRLRNTPIIICTPYMLGRIRRGCLRSSNIKVVIDEFSQIDPAVFFMTLSRISIGGERNVRGGYTLLGDPLQLPVVTTQQELMENVIEFLKSYHAIDGGFNALTLQYRMHEEICNAVNRMRKELSYWYDSIPLEPADNNIRHRDLRSLGYKYMEEKVPNGSILTSRELKEILEPTYTFVIINTDKLPRSNAEERTKSGSLRNITEAEAVIDIAIAAHQSYQAQDRQLTPTIISPYSAQINEIKERLRKRYSDYYGVFESNIITAYSSQGREYPMVIVSLVRSNPWRRIGFLEDEKLRAQVYVACSRAQAKLIVLMSKNTFGGKPLYEELVKVEGSRHALVLGWD
jgi:hypothetical protein